jgi:hypothetical protein
MVSLETMDQPTGREAVLHAFDRLFDRASEKLHLECTAEEKEEVRRHFVKRYDEALQVLDQADFPAFSDGALETMEASIDTVPMAHVAGYLAIGPLTAQVQTIMRRLALRAAEQRLLEHLVSQADDQYGGN